MTGTLDLGVYALRTAYASGTLDCRTVIDEVLKRIATGLDANRSQVSKNSWVSVPGADTEAPVAGGLVDRVARFASVVEVASRNSPDRGAGAQRPYRQGPFQTLEPGVDRERPDRCRGRWIWTWPRT